MTRHIVTEAVVLKAKAFSEADRKILFLSPELGLLDAFVYGTARGKSRLASGTDTLSGGLLYLYHDPVKGVYKVTDLKSSNLFLGIKNSLPKYYRALLWSEIIIKSLGGQDSSKVVFSLFHSCLEWLDKLESPAALDLINLQFLWRYLSYQGYTMGTEYCSSCGKKVEEREPVYLSRGENPFVCGGCTYPDSPSLNPGTRRYLEKTGSLGLEQTLQFSIGPEAAKEANRLLLSYMEIVFETALETRRISGGYL